MLVSSEGGGLDEARCNRPPECWSVAGILLNNRKYVHGFNSQEKKEEGRTHRSDLGRELRLS